MEWLTIAGFAIAGFFAIAHLFDKNAKSQKEEFSKQEDKLRKLYQEEIGVLGKKVDEQADTIKELTKKVDTVTVENNLLKSIVTGTDDSTQKYRAKAEASMELATRTHAMVLEIQKSVEKNGKETLKNIERLYKAIEKHLEKEAKVIQSK